MCNDFTSRPSGVISKWPRARESLEKNSAFKTLLNNYNLFAQDDYSLQTYQNTYK